MNSDEFAAYWEWYLEQDAKRRASTSKGTLEREPADRPTIAAGELDEEHDPIRGAVRRGACTQRTSAVAGELGDGVRGRTFSLPEPEEIDDVDVVKCWCGVVGRYDEMFSVVPPGCGGTGYVDCLCGGDQCVCHNHGETECDGCDECDGEDEEYARDMGDEVSA